MTGLAIAPAPLVKANGARIPAIGLGTWQMAGAECVRAVTSALKIGYRHLDTAAMYGNEAEVGEGLRASGIDRGDVFVTTKVWWDSLADGALQASAERSLKSLGLDTIDLLLIHWPNPRVSIAECVGALCETKRRGLARHIGVANFPVKLLEEAVAVATEPLVCNQFESHPRLNQSKLMSACRKHGMAVVSYCPIGKGEVLGLDVIKEIAAARGRTTAQIVLRWQTQRPGVVAIPKSANAGRQAENLDVFGFSLSDDEMARIDKLARPGGRILDPAFSPDWD
jgi:diketogulonate reductase-like aldo/keto reductase